MKRAILTIAAVLLCALSFAQKKVIAQEGGNILSYSESAGVYVLTMKDDLSGKSFDIMLTQGPKCAAGLFEILEGILSGKYPDNLAVNQGGAYATAYRDAERGLVLIDYKGTFGTIDADTARKFREAITAKK